MKRTYLKLAISASAVLALSGGDLFAGGGGRGGGYGGGYGGHAGSYSGGAHPTGSYGGGGGAYGAHPGGGYGGTYGAHPQSGSGYAGGSSANRNYPNAGAAAAGAGYANHNNQSAYPNAGAAATGAGYANRNQGAYPNAGAAAVGAGYANRNGTWNGSGAYGALGYGAYGAAYGGYGAGMWGGVGAWGVGSPMYSYGYSGYSNPYMGGMGGYGYAGGQQGLQPQQGGAPAYSYAQPLSTATPTEPAASDNAKSAFDKAIEAFRSNDYSSAHQLVQQALGQSPNDLNMHEFLALVLFAQGKYEQAASPLYAVLSVGPGWDWTSLIGNYSDAALYTKQLRGLETYIKSHPKSAQARFVLAYHYIAEGHIDMAADQLKRVVTLEPNDTLSAQILTKLKPASADAAPAPPAESEAFDAGKLAGVWVAKPQGAKITLAIKDDGAFDWTVDAPGKPPGTISGKSSVEGGVLILDNAKAGKMSGNVVWKDAQHFVFKLMGAPSEDPGLAFSK